MRRKLASVTVSFLLVALVVAVGLIGASVALLLDSRNALFGGLLLGAGLSMLAALWPRHLLGEPDGVLVPDRSPLRALVPEVDELRIVLEPNAWAARHRGRTVVALGLPLIASLDREALRGVIAHELAHIERDTGFERLAAHGHRTFAQMHCFEGVAWAPARAYARLYFAVSASLSRAAERAADAVAIARVGGPARARALAASPAIDVTWARFWTERVRPALNAGLRPPLARGYAAFLATDDARATPVPIEPPPGRFDSHPPLDARIAAAGGTDETWPRGADPDLLMEASARELGLLAGVAGVDTAAALRPVEWEALPAGSPVAEVQRRALGPFAADLWTLPKTRAGALFALALLGSTIVPLTAVCVWAAFNAEVEDPAAARLVGVGVGVAGLLALWLTARSHWAKLGPRGRVRTQGDELVIEHPRLLRSPFTVPLSRVTAVAVDPDGDDRFLVHPDTPWDTPADGGAAPLGHLRSAGFGALPLFDVTSDAPNVAILFDERVDGPAVRRRREHGPASAVPLPGLLLRVEDPASLIAAGAGRELRAGDLRAFGD